MRVFLTRSSVSAACIVLAVSTVSSEELSRYREFQLGASLAAVTAITQSTERDLKIVHSRPALLQQLEWRPRYMRGTPVAGRDSINELLFSFVDDRLFRMSVAYERDRTTGLTNEDMIASLTAVYGAPSSPSPRLQSPVGPEGLDTPLVIAEWRQADTNVALQRNRYNESFVLVITSLSLDAIARKAQATAVVMDVREAPAREAALLKKRADDQRQAEEQARETNKKVFRP
jgi:hypothetical protein